MRAILHCHSKFSYDSKIKIDQIIDFCVNFEINFLIISDHDTIKGSLEAAKKIKLQGLDIICPPAAEYKTDLGDIILVGLTYELERPTFDELVEISNNNDNCRLLLPHAYHDHLNIEYLANNVDFIEIFNSRCSSNENEKAKKLAKSFKKLTYASPDAHTLPEYKNCIISYDIDDIIHWTKILEKNWKYYTKQKTSLCQIYISTIIKSLKIKSFNVLIKSLIKICIFCIFYKKYK